MDTCIYTYLYAHLSHKHVTHATSMQGRTEGHTAVCFRWREHDLIHHANLPLKQKLWKTFSATNLPERQTLRDTAFLATPNC